MLNILKDEFYYKKLNANEFTNSMAIEKDMLEAMSTILEGVVLCY